MKQVISNSGHDGMIHDASLDYYGRRLATCSSDRTVRVFEVVGEHRLIETLRGHEGAVWCVEWAHPKFGTMLASCSYDGKVIFWREHTPSNASHPATAAPWSRVFDFTQHTASVNMLAWAPSEYGCILGTASSDGTIAVVEFKDNSWTHQMFPGHRLGVNAIAWASISSVGAGAHGEASQPPKLVTGGSDHLVKIWGQSPDTQTYSCLRILEGHTDWVRDVAWSPSVYSRWYVATASQDKTVRIWTCDAANGKDWKSQTIQFDCILWRVSWSLNGNVLAVSGGDNNVSLWKENLKGEWEKVKDIEE